MLVNCSFVLDTETGEVSDLDMVNVDFASLKQRDQVVINLFNDLVCDAHFDINEIMSDLQEGDCISPMCPGESWVCENCSEYQAYIKEDN
jgi:hypothetical protein